MNYKTMVENARRAGTATEKTMWESIDNFAELLEEFKEAHPEQYWKFMRKQHGLLFHKHYDEAFAMYDVAQMHSTDKKGEKKIGAHWTSEQIETATVGMKFPQGTTRWDRFVAFNGAYHDWRKDYEDGDILKMGYDFYFADDDWGSETKVWDYMSCRH